MTNTDREQFTKWLFLLAEGFKEPMSELRLEAYWMALEHEISIVQMGDAVREALRSSKFFPRPAELREYIQGNPKQLAEAAWIAWREGARRLGAGASVIFADIALAD